VVVSDRHKLQDKRNLSQKISWKGWLEHWLELWQEETRLLRRIRMMRVMILMTIGPTKQGMVSIRNMTHLTPILTIVRV